MILRNLEDQSEGIVINGVKISNLICRWYCASRWFSPGTWSALVFRSTAKTMKCMVILKSEVLPTCRLWNRNVSIEHVSSFNHLGALVTSDAQCQKEIRRRIRLSKMNTSSLDLFSAVKNCQSQLRCAYSKPLSGLHSSMVANQCCLAPKHCSSGDVVLPTQAPGLVCGPSYKQGGVQSSWDEKRTLKYGRAKTIKISGSFNQERISSRPEFNWNNWRTAKENHFSLISILDLSGKFGTQRWIKLCGTR